MPPPQDAIEQTSATAASARRCGPATLYQMQHTFATLMLELGESPGWVAQQLGHTSVEMVYRRYHRFIPNLRGRDGVNAARGLASEGL